MMKRARKATCHIIQYTVLVGQNHTSGLSKRIRAWISTVVAVHLATARSTTNGQVGIPPVMNESGRFEHHSHGQAHHEATYFTLSAEQMLQSTARGESNNPRLLERESAADGEQIRSEL